jgi:hypothetical protein
MLRFKCVMPMSFQLIELCCRGLRAATFIGSGMSGLFPVIHMLFIGLEGNWISAQYILLMGFLYVPLHVLDFMLSSTHASAATSLAHSCSHFGFLRFIFLAVMIFGSILTNGCTFASLPQRSFIGWVFWSCSRYGCRRLV